MPEARSVDEAGAVMVDKVRRMLFRTGFFALRQIEILATPVTTFHVPYWVVMAGPENDLRVQVFDAVRCRPEGAKVRALVRQWLTAA